MFFKIYQQTKFFNTFSNPIQIENFGLILILPIIGFIKEFKPLNFT